MPSYIKILATNMVKNNYPNILKMCVSGWILPILLVQYNDAWMRLFFAEY
jgi:hypothetical protein